VIPVSADVPDLDVIFVGEPDRSNPVGVKGLGGFFLDEGVDLLVEGEVVGVHGVLGLVRDVEVGHLRRVARGGERVDPGLDDVLDTAQRADHQPVGEGGAPVGEVAAGLVAVIAGRQDEVLAARALVRASQAEVGDVAEPEVVEDAERVRRVLDDRRPVRFQVQEH